MTLHRLNSLDHAAFVAELGDLFEHSPWVADRAAATRPHHSPRALHNAMLACVNSAPEAEQIALIRAHPELAGREADAGTLTEASTTEQSRLGLNRLSPAEHAELAAINAAYQEKFGFPCIVALRQHTTRHSVLAEMHRRLEAPRDLEIATAIRQIAAITEGRLVQRLRLAGAWISTHALDTAQGRPAEGLAITLSLDDGTGLRPILNTITNADGRTAEPLVAGLDMMAATWQLEFHVGDYHRRRGMDSTFLNVVPLVFAVADPAQHYHVPLLFTPWSYSTYRGS